MLTHRRPKLNIKDWTKGAFNNYFDQEREGDPPLPEKNKNDTGKKETKGGGGEGYKIITVTWRFFVSFCACSRLRLFLCGTAVSPSLAMSPNWFDGHTLCCYFVCLSVCLSVCFSPSLPRPSRCAGFRDRCSHNAHPHHCYVYSLSGF